MVVAIEQLYNGPRCDPLHRETRCILVHTDAQVQPRGLLQQVHLCIVSSQKGHNLIHKGSICDRRLALHVPALIFRIGSEPNRVRVACDH